MMGVYKRHIDDRVFGQVRRYTLAQFHVYKMLLFSTLHVNGNK